MALAEAIIEHVHDTIKAKTLFSTHYHELTVLEERLPGLKNVHVGAVEEEGNLVFLHQMLPGPADKSYGVQVAKLAGLPHDLLERAEHILHELEQKEENLFETDDSSVKEKKPSVVNETSSMEQLNLFGELSEKEYEALEQLKSMNVMNTTPFEALQLLNELQTKLNKG